MRDTASTLARVAQKLGVPVEAFLLDQKTMKERLVRNQQSVEMVKAFEEVKCPKARSRCIRLIKELAGAL